MPNLLKYREPTSNNITAASSRFIVLRRDRKREDDKVPSTVERTREFYTAMEIRHLVASSLPSSRSRSLAEARETLEKREADTQEESRSFSSRSRRVHCRL